MFRGVSVCLVKTLALGARICLQGLVGYHVPGGNPSFILRRVEQLHFGHVERVPPRGARACLLVVAPEIYRVVGLPVAGVEGGAGLVVRDGGEELLLAARQRLPEGRERSEEHTSELQSRQYLVCRLLLETKIRSEAHTS